MKKNRLLTLTILPLSLAFIGIYATTARSQLPPPSQGPTGSMSETFKNPHCPNKVSLEVSMKYPINTGNAKVDAFFEKMAADYMAENTRQARNFGPADCQITTHAFWHGDYKSFKPNPETLGVIINTSENGGGSGTFCVYLAYNFDLRTGREFDIKDFFINPGIGINGIYGYAYADLCKKTASHVAAEEVMGGQCGRDRNAPRKLLALRGSLDGLGHLVLTERGADLNFCHDELWHKLHGDYTLPIPKNTLIKFGARDFWGPSVPNF
ncbi:MAG: hypothetical protein LBF40_03965 [Deltaproteobacteria bacterium]|jgi:hypothetical protein|nr:hypothetical protein [Deltaproteobacteria bacterium]